jgi:transcription elongation factor Elf1
MAPKGIQSSERAIRCPLCDKRDVVPTMQRRWWDFFFRMIEKSPWVCRACGRRFYVKQNKLAQRLS